jgi:hypothetical protein
MDKASYYVNVYVSIVRAITNITKMIGINGIGLYD